jgi:asparagine N-glycosylation enzyme membrane subunit Stt3
MDSALQISAVVIAYFVFGFIGYRFSRTFKRPVSALTWVILSLATVLAFYVLPGTILFSLFDFRILLGVALNALAVGVLFGLIVREIRLKRQSPEQPFSQRGASPPGTNA